MPQVRTYDQQVQSRNLPSARLTGADPADMGANLGRGLQSLGSDLMQIAADERRKKIDADLTAADNDLQRLTLGALRKAQDPRDGVKGATVADDVRRLSEAWDKGESEIAGRLTDPEARRLWGMRSSQRRVSFGENLAGHADKVVQVYQVDQQASRLRLADERIALTYDKPEEVLQANVDKEEALAQLAILNNWSPERAAVERTQAMSAGHMLVVRGFVGAGRTGEADAWLKGVPDDQMTTKDRELARKVVAETSDTQAAQGIADQAHALIQSGLLKPTEAEDWLKEQAGDNVRRRDDARNRLRVLQASYEAAVREEVGKAETDALRILSETDGDITKVKADPDIMGTLQRHNPAAVRELEKAAAGWKPKAATDDMAWLALRGTDPAALAAMSPVEFHNQFRARFADADWEQAVTYWGQTRAAERDANAKAEVDQVFNGARSERQVIDQTLTAMGFDPTVLDATKQGPGSDAAKNAVFVAGLIDKALAERKRELSEGRKGRVTNLPEDEVQKVVSATLKAVAKPGKGFWGGDKPTVLEVQPVPEADRAAIFESYRRRFGRDPSPQELVDTYVAGRTKGIALPAPAAP